MVPLREARVRLFRRSRCIALCFQYRYSALLQLAMASALCAVSIPAQDWADTNDSCTASWPREDPGNFCYQEMCRTGEHMINLRGLDITDLACSEIISDQLLTVEDAGCPAGHTPGPPRMDFYDTGVFVEYGVLTPHFSIAVRWRDPDDDTNLIGYRLELKSFAGNILESFYFSKETTASPAYPRLNTMEIVPHTGLCANNDLWPCIVTKLLASGQLIGQSTEAEYKIVVTSLPLKDATDSRGHSVESTLNIPSCEDMGCLRDVRVSEPSCQNPSHPVVQMSDHLCKCSFKEPISFANISVTIMNATTGSAYVSVFLQWVAPIQCTLRVVVYRHGQRLRCRSTQRNCRDQLILNSTNVTSFPQAVYHILRIGHTLHDGDHLKLMVETVDTSRIHTIASHVYSSPTALAQSPSAQSKAAFDQAASTSNATRPYIDVTSTGDRDTSSSVEPETYSDQTIIVYAGIAASISLIILICIILVISLNYQSGRRKGHVSCCRCARRVVQDVTLAGTEDLSEQCRLPINNKRVYISYSRMTDRIKENTLHLYHALRQEGVNVILDAYHQQEILEIGMEPWISHQVTCSKFVIVILDEGHPLNLTQLVKEELLRTTDCDELQRALVECSLIQSAMFTGQMNFIVPVLIGSTSVGQVASVPHTLREKTLYRLPADFNAQSETFRSLLGRLHGPVVA